MGTGIIALIVFFVVSFSLLIYLFIWGTRQIGKDKGEGRVYKSGDMIGRTHKAFKFASFWLSLMFIALFSIEDTDKPLMLLLKYICFCMMMFLDYGLVAMVVNSNGLDNEKQKFQIKALQIVILHTFVWTSIFWVVYMIFILA